MTAAGGALIDAGPCPWPIGAFFIALGLFIAVGSLLRRGPWSGETRVELLRRQYERGCSLQQSLAIAIGSAQSSEQEADAEDRARCLVREWAQETWSVIHEYFAAHEKEFPGVRDRTLGETEPALAAASEVFVEGYLERVLDFVAEKLKEYDK